MDEEDDLPAWRADAIELYRVAFVALSEGVWPQDFRTEYLIDEVREALLDLKLAVTGDDEAFATRTAREIFLLFYELRNRDAE